MEFLLKTRFLQIRDFILDLVFPKKCIGCGNEGTFLCENCCEKLPQLKPPFCAQCGIPIESNDLSICFGFGTRSIGFKIKILDGVLRRARYRSKSSTTYYSYDLLGFLPPALPTSLSETLYHAAGHCRKGIFSTNLSKIGFSIFSTSKSYK